MWAREGGAEYTHANYGTTLPPLLGALPSTCIQDFSCMLKFCINWMRPGRDRSTRALGAGPLSMLERRGLTGENPCLSHRESMSAAA